MGIPDQCRFPNKHWHSDQVYWCSGCHSGCGWFRFRGWNWDSVWHLDHWLCQDPSLEQQLFSYAIGLCLVWGHGVLPLDGCLPHPFCHVRLHGNHLPIPAALARCSAWCWNVLSFTSKHNISLETNTQTHKQNKRGKPLEKRQSSATKSSWLLTENFASPVWPAPSASPIPRPPWHCGWQDEGSHLDFWKL